MIKMGQASRLPASKRLDSGSDAPSRRYQIWLRKKREAPAGVKLPEVEQASGPKSAPRSIGQSGTGFQPVNDRPMTVSLQDKLLGWYHTNCRSLPWRENPEPYWV